MMSYRMGVCVAATLVSIVTGCGAPTDSADTVVGTDVIRFDPGSLSVESSATPLSAECGGSAVLPQPGAYKCETEAGGVLDPCFVHGDDLLGCLPDPEQGIYASAVTPSNEIQVVHQPAGAPIAFYVLLDGNHPPCSRRSADLPLDIAGMPVTFNCEAPGAFIVDRLDTSQQIWTALHVVTDTNAETVTAGPTDTDIATAWVY
jgi:hypothetical protein